MREKKDKGTSFAVKKGKGIRFVVLRDMHGEGHGVTGGQGDKFGGKGDNLGRGNVGQVDNGGTDRPVGGGQGLVLLPHPDGLSLSQL